LFYIVLHLCSAAAFLIAAISVFTSPAVLRLVRPTMTKNEYEMSAGNNTRIF